MTPAAWAPMVRLLCDRMSDAGGAMFAVPLSSSGESPATDFISSGLIGADFCALLPLTSFDADGMATTRPGQPVVVVALAAEAGIVVTLERITEMLTAVQVTEESWQAALERRDLVRIQAKPI